MTGSTLAAVKHSKQALALAAIDRESIAEATGPWVPGMGPSRGSTEAERCGCIRLVVCGACQGNEPRWPARHRECWGLRMVERFSFCVSIHDGTAGKVFGLTGQHLYVYEAGYHHRWLCGCKEAGHPGLGEYADKEQSNLADLRWAEGIGLRKGPGNPDRMGTPSLFDGRRVTL